MTILLTADLVVLQHAPDGAHDAGGVGAPHRGGGRRHAQPALLIRGVNGVFTVVMIFDDLKFASTYCV